MVILQLDQQPVLVQAIFAGELEEVRTALDFKQDVNSQDSERRSPLHAASYKGDTEIAALLLLHGARVNIKDSRWITPLHRACCCGSADLVSLLLQHQADITARDRHWQTPLHVAAANNAVDCVVQLLNCVPNPNVADRMGRTALHHAAVNGHNDIVELLITKGCIVNACDKKDCRPLHCAAHMGHVDTIELLLRGGADINAKDRNQYSPLHVAAASGMVTACRALLSGGAHVDARNAYGNTPLHIACLNGHLPVCQVLLSFGANVEASNYRGQTPLHIAAASTHGVDCLNYLVEKQVDINRQSLDGRTPLHMTAIHGRFTRSKTLIDKGAIVDCTDKNGCTALHIAAQYGHDLLSNTLLSFGADPSKKGYAGRTPLHMSCLSGYVECCRKFLQASVDLNAQDDSGKTPVHCAAYKGSVECLDLLVSNGANFDVVDNIGRLPLHYAAVQGHYPCVFTLVGLGSPVNLCDSEGCSPLHLAAAYDIKGECVEYLLRHKADPKLKDNKGFTPIHYAVAGENCAGLGFLLSMVGNNYVMHGTNMPLTTPLHLAARNGNQDILRLLLSYFHNTNIRAQHGSTALLLAARSGHTHCVQMLLRFGAKVAISDTIHNMSPVHYSARNGHIHCLALLLDNTEDKNVIDAPDSLQRTALMLAVSGGHTECANTLLKCGADPNIVDADKHSSLFRAVVNGQHNAVQLLIAHGAKVNIPDVNGKTVLHLAAACGHLSSLQMILKHIEPAEATALDNQECTALHWACYSGNPNSVSFLLEQNIFTNLEGNIFSPVHCATFVGAERCVELLCKHYGADIVKLKDARNRTPLHIAALHGHVDCAKYLLEQEAEIDCKDLDGRTPLIAAAQNGQSQILDLLISYKADMTSYDNNGNTALHSACLKRHSHSALLLLEHIEDANIVNMINNDRKTPLHLSARNGLVNVTRQLISKGSSVLALDINGMTPALCCAPNNNVAQCLALILANYAICSPEADAKERPISRSVSSASVLQKSKSKKLKTYKSKRLQTDISLVRNPDYFECQRMLSLKASKKTRTSEEQPSRLKTVIHPKTMQQLLRNSRNEDIQEFMPHDSKDCKSSCFLIETYKPESTDGPVREKVFGHNLHESYSNMFIAYQNELNALALKKVLQEGKAKRTGQCSKAIQDALDKRKNHLGPAAEKKKIASSCQNLHKTVRKIAQEIITLYNPNLNQEELLHAFIQGARKLEESRGRLFVNKNVPMKTLEEELKATLTQYLIGVQNIAHGKKEGSHRPSPPELVANEDFKRALEQILRKVQQKQQGDDDPNCLVVQSRAHIKGEEYISESALRQNRTQKVAKHSAKQPMTKRCKSAPVKQQKKNLELRVPADSNVADWKLDENLKVPKSHVLKTDIQVENNVMDETRNDNMVAPNISDFHCMDVPQTSSASSSDSQDCFEKHTAHSSPNPDIMSPRKLKIIETGSDDEIIKMEHLMQQESHVDDVTMEKIRHFHRSFQATRSSIWKNPSSSDLNESNKKIILEGLELISSSKLQQLISKDVARFDATLDKWPEQFPWALEIMKRIIAALKKHEKQPACAPGDQEGSPEVIAKNDILMGKGESCTESVRPVLTEFHCEPTSSLSDSKNEEAKSQNFVCENVGTYDNISGHLMTEQNGKLNEDESEYTADDVVISGVISMVPYSEVQKEMKVALECDGKMAEETSRLGDSMRATEKCNSEGPEKVPNATKDHPEDFLEEKGTELGKSSSHAATAEEKVEQKIGKKNSLTLATAKRKLLSKPKEIACNIS